MVMVCNRFNYLFKQLYAILNILFFSHVHTGSSYSLNEMQAIRTVDFKRSMPYGYAFSKGTLLLPT